MFIEGIIGDHTEEPLRDGEYSSRLCDVYYPTDSDQKNSDRFTLGPYRFDLKNKKAFNLEKPIKLTKKDFDLAVCLFSNFGNALSRSYLLEKVWGVSANIQSRTVDVHICRIRKAFVMGEGSNLEIKAVYQCGYCLEYLEL